MRRQRRTEPGGEKEGGGGRGGEEGGGRGDRSGQERISENQGIAVLPLGPSDGKKVSCLGSPVCSVRVETARYRRRL